MCLNLIPSELGEAFFFFGILDKILGLHHGVQLLDFCKGLEQPNFLPSPPDLCDLEVN